MTDDEIPTRIRAAHAALLVFTEETLKEIARLSFIAGRRSGIKEIMPHTTQYKSQAKKNKRKKKRV